MAAIALLLTSSASPLLAAEVRGGWGSWWLPPDHSTHGWAIDSLFNWIFWITMVAFVLVEVVLLVFLIQYRRRPGKAKAHFTHGNTRLEMCWTLAPAVILAVLALASKKVWDNYRYSPAGDDPNRAIVLVIGEQFKWNVIYPGPDGKLGRYLMFPKPSDVRWQNPDGSGKDFAFQGVKGPADLPYDQAVKACSTYIDQVNKLGKDFGDPDGKDDDWGRNPGRELVLPVGRSIEVQLSSRDVLHDFFLPNFRVKLDAVPGMRGRIFVTAKTTSTAREQASRKEYTLDELAAEMKNRQAASGDLAIAIGEGMPGAEKDRTGWRYVDVKGARDPKRPATIIRHGAAVPLEPDKFTTMVDKLRANGIERVTAYRSGEWELVCEELCGQGHNTMRGTVRIIDGAEYDALKLDKPSGGSLATPAPVAAAAAAGQ